MARPLRIEYAGAFYHVMNRGLERREIFREKKDYEAFLDLSLEIHRRFKVIFHAYCLMPNHYHLMVETPAANLSRAMRHVDGVYTQRFNKRRGRVGPLFQGRYKAVLVDQESYSLQLIRYIHLNPVKAGIVKNPEDHPYSSLRFYTRDGKPAEFLETGWVLKQFHKGWDQARRAFRQFTLEGLRDSWSPEKGLRAGMILGSARFYETVRRQYLEGKTDREIPALRKTQSVPELGEIRACVESCVEEAALRRRLLVWALKKYTPLKLKEIAEGLQSPISYSAVSQISRRLQEEQRRNPRLQSLIKRVETEMSNVKT